MEENLIHRPVMKKEVLEFLNLKPGDVVVDCTVGGGGHSIGILNHIMPGGKLIGIDQDREVLDIARENLRDYKGNSELIYGNFRNLDKILNDLKIDKVDAILYDLGVSSYQLDKAERGFSFLKEGPLDMRMDRGLRITAFDLVNNLSKEEISKILFEYGQERYAHRIASSIVKRRSSKPISSTSQLANIVKSAIPFRRGKINPATRTFLAFRIAVNRELEALETSLMKAVPFLRDKSRICVISFHSLEDRIVKNKFKEFAHKDLLRILTKKPITPRREEIRENPRARSAKLRVAVKVG